MKYRETGIEWLGKIPEHWEHTTIKNHFYVVPSNVDKKIKDNEIPVELCNYVDVYYNDFIDLSVPFMEATANENEVRKFQLKEKDVLITKDSEDPLDIGVPALIIQVKDKLLCGYHLSRLRTKSNKITGDYLFWLLSDTSIASQLWREATGVTRWAIASRHVKNSTIPLPPKQEQTAIVKYLSKACERIDKVVEIKEKQLLNMEANINALINEFVSGKKALKPYSKYNSSNIEWLGDIPSSWETKRLFNICQFVRGNSSFKKDELLDEGKYVALQYGKTYKVDEVNEEFKFYVNDNFYKSSQTVVYGDVIFVSTSETIEDLGHSVFYNRKDIGLIGGEQILLKPNKNILDGKFLFYATRVFGKELNKFATGLKVFRFDVFDLKTVYVPIPPIKEQKAIVEHLDKSITKIKKIKSIIESQIEILQAYRKNLIHECVTGKKQVIK